MLHDYYFRYGMPFQQSSAKAAALQIVKHRTYTCEQTAFAFRYRSDNY